MNKINLTKRELEVMNVLWHSGEALTIAEIENRASNISINTIRVTVKRLLEKKYVMIDKVVPQGHLLTREFRPVILKEEYLLSQLETTDTSLLSIVSSLVKREKNKENLEVIEKEIKEQLRILENEDK